MYVISIESPGLVEIENTHSPKENPKVRLQPNTINNGQNNITYWTDVLKNLHSTLFRVLWQGRRLCNLKVNQYRRSCQRNQTQCLQGEYQHLSQHIQISKHRSGRNPDTEERTRSNEARGGALPSGLSIYTSVVCMGKMGPIE